MFSKPGKFSNQEHHFHPEKKAANTGHVVLPSVETDVLLEWMALVADKKYGNNDEHVSVSIPSPEVRFSIRNYLCNFTEDVKDDKKCQKHPGSKSNIERMVVC